jgi:hypothetical protein
MKSHQEAFKKVLEVMYTPTEHWGPGPITKL